MRVLIHNFTEKLLLNLVLRADNSSGGYIERKKIVLMK